MGNIWIKSSSSIQLWLINHNNCITAPILASFYLIDLIAYSVSGPLKFLTRRSDLFGPNYAALGRLIVGEYAKCAELIQSPQKRDYYLGRAKLMPRKMPKNFILFLSDSDAGGSDVHSVIHQHLWETLIPPAFDRLSDPVFQAYLSNAASNIKARGDKIHSSEMNSIVNNMTIKYVFHSMFGIVLTDEQIKKVETLFFGVNPMSSAIIGAAKPFGFLFGCFQCKRRRLFDSMTKAVYDSPAMHNYVPSADNGNMTRVEHAELLLALAGIAGCVGSSNLCKNVISQIPKDYPIDLGNKMDVALAVLEAARIKSPVNNVNSILTIDLTLKVNGKEFTFPPGTHVAACIGLASCDSSEFQDPKKFNPKRENLMKSTLNFNHVGFSPLGAGKRQCPGRNIAMKVGGDLLIELRKDYSPPLIS